VSEGGDGRGRLGIAEEEEEEEEGFTVANALAFTNFFVAIFCFSTRPNYLKMFLERKKKTFCPNLLFIVNCKIFIKTFSQEEKMSAEGSG